MTDYPALAKRLREIARLERTIWTNADDLEPDELVARPRHLATADTCEEAALACDALAERPEPVTVHTCAECDSHRPGSYYHPETCAREGKTCESVGYTCGRWSPKGGNSR